MSKSVIDEVLKEHDISQNDEIFIKQGNNEYILTEGRVKELTAKFIEACSLQATKYRDFGMNAKVVELLIDVKKAWWPATQKSLTANVDFDKELNKWYETQKTLLKEKGEVVVEVTASDDR